MAKFRVLVTDYAWPDLDIERELLSKVDADLIVADEGDEEELCRLAPEADAILVCWRDLAPSVLEAAARCRVISRYGIGLDNIPVEQATELGMLVTRVPDFCADEVAEHVLALVLALTRGLVGYSQRAKAGVWSQSSDRVVSRLRGKVLGLVGYGTLARGVVPRARGFGMKLLAHTSRLSQADVEPGVEVASSLEELLSRSDFVSLHLPLTDESRHLINQRTLAQMRPGAYLINTSRGGIVDEEALIRALGDGRIAGAGLDVLDPEPPSASNPLLTLPNVIVTPHVAFYSVEAVEELQRRAAGHVADVLEGRIPPHLVNPEVLDSPNCRFS